MEKREKFFPNSSFHIKVNKKQNKDNSQSNELLSCDFSINKPQKSRNPNNCSKDKEKNESCYISNRLDNKNSLNLGNPPSSANNKEFKYKKINIINRYNKKDIIKSNIKNRQKYSCINNNKNNRKNIEIDNNNDNETGENYFMLRSETQYPLYAKKNYSDTLMANSNNSMRNLNFAYNTSTEKNQNSNITPKFKMNSKIDIRKKINNVNESYNYENNTFDKKVDVHKSENKYSNLTFNKLGHNFYKPTHKRINNNLENNNSPNPINNKSNFNNDIKSDSRYTNRAYRKGNFRIKEIQKNYNNTIQVNNSNMKEKALEEKEKSEKKLITIYRTKLITIFVSLMKNVCNKYKKKVFSEIINILKNNTYNNVQNKKFKKNKNNYYYIKKNKANINNLKDDNNDDNNFTKKYTKILFNNKDLSPITMYRKVTNNNQHSQLRENKDIRSIYKNSTMPNVDLSKSSSTNIYIPVKKRNIYNYPSKQKETIFDELKINKSYKFVDNNQDNQDIYQNRNININSQINHFYNTNNNNFYINRINSFNSIISLEKPRPHPFISKNYPSESSNDISSNNKIDKEEESHKAIKCSLFKNKSKFQNIFYKKILPNEKLQKSEKKRNEKVNVFMKRLERLCIKDKNKNNQNQTYSKRRIIKDGSKSNYNYYYSNFNHTLENNEVNELSNDVNNYCLEDIDKPTNMMYSKTNIINIDNDNDNDDENIYNDEISEEIDVEMKNLMKIITNDKRLFLNFNYISLNNNKSPNSKRSKKKYNILSISERNSLCFIIRSKNNNIYIDNNNSENVIEDYSFKEDSNTLRTNLNKFSRKRKLKFGLLKLENITNNKIYEYKTIFFGLLKQLKFIFIINKITENRSMDILKKYFDRFKNNIQSEMNDSFSKMNKEMNNKKFLDKQNINHIIDDNKNTDIIQNKEKLKSLIKQINKNSRNKFQNNLKDLNNNLLSEEERNEDKNSGNIDTSLSLGKQNIYNSAYKKMTMSNSKSVYSKKKISVKNICELNDFDIFEKKIENFRLKLIKFSFFEK